MENEESDNNLYSTTYVLKDVSSQKQETMNASFMPECIEDMFPEDTNIISWDYSSEKDYTAEVRLRCKTKDEFKLWLADFEQRSFCSYRVLVTYPKTGQKILYKASYRCHRNTYPSSHRFRLKKPSRKHTGCSAKLHVTIKSIIEGRRNRSNDTLLNDYPTIVRIYNKHNHDIEIPKTDASESPDEVSSLALKTEENFEPEISRNDLEEESKNEQMDKISEMQWEKFNERLKNMDTKLKEKFLENPTFSPALDNMLSKFECMDTDVELLSAMFNFGKNQSKIVTTDKKYQEKGRPVIHTL